MAVKTCNENEIKLFQFLVPLQEKRNDDSQKIASCICAYCPFSCFISNSIKTPNIAAAHA